MNMNGQMTEKRPLITEGALSARAVSKYISQIDYSERHGHMLPSVLAYPDTWDAWRHHRMYGHLEPLLALDPKGSWLTIGDNGADANYIRSRSSGRIVASSISRAPLDAVASAGFLQNVEIREMNAEAIEAEASSFDYVYCKEAYHHFARPPIGLYEFFRVARKAVILCEPSDVNPQRALNIIRLCIKFLLRGERSNMIDFEPAGNFIFRLSIPELRKIATAIGFSRVYWRYFNDFYIRKLAEQSRTNLFGGAMLRCGIAMQDICCSLRLMNWGKCTVVIWMPGVEQRVDENLTCCGFHRFDVPMNPYV
jgi:hypothetical protein